MGTFRQFLTVICPRYIRFHCFHMITWVNTKLGVCIDIVEIWFNLITWVISTHFHPTWYVHWYYGDGLRWFEIAIGYLSFIFEWVISPRHDKFIIVPHFYLALVSMISFVFIPLHTIVGRYYGFTLDVRLPYIRPSVCFSFLDDNLSKHQWVFTKLGMCIDIVKMWFGIANGQILAIPAAIPRRGNIQNQTSANQTNI